jgi:hypothetical protein
MELLQLQKQAAIWKRKAYEAKTDYYKEKLKQKRFDL